MGADMFEVRMVGESASKSFKEAREEAMYESGCSYSGTISQKSGYSMSRKPEGIDADTWIEMVCDFDEDDKDQEHYSALKRDSRIYEDKWANALCVPTKDGFIFCGYASS